MSNTNTTAAMDLETSIANHFAAKLRTPISLVFREEDFGFDNSLTVRVNGVPYDVFYNTSNEITLSCPA